MAWVWYSVAAVACMFIFEIALWGAPPPETYAVGAIVIVWGVVRARRERMPADPPDDSEHGA
jgi:hypothetical protein